MTTDGSDESGKRACNVIRVDWRKRGSRAAPQLDLTAERRWSLQAWGLGVAATAALFVSVGALVAYELDHPPAEIIKTGSDETRTRVFGDGIQVLLDELTKLQIDAVKTCCRARLLVGRVLFTVPQNPARKLTVATDFAAASTTGGKFSAEINWGLVVQVDEGEVQVSGPGGILKTLVKGERYRVLDDGRLRAGVAALGVHSGG